MSGPIAMDVSDGIGFVWIVPPGFRIVVQCAGEITSEGTLIKIGSWCGDIKWHIPPAVNDPFSPLDPIVRYPVPLHGDDGTTTHRRLLDIIAKLVGDPLSV